MNNLQVALDFHMQNIANTPEYNCNFPFLFFFLNKEFLTCFNILTECFNSDYINYKNYYH